MNSVVLQLSSTSPSSHSLEINSCSLNSYIVSSTVVRESLSPDANLEMNSTNTSKILSEASLWYHRMGHLNFPYLAQLSRKDTDIPLLPVPNNQQHCTSCHQGKNAKTKFPKGTTTSAIRILDLVHSNLYGPLPVYSIGSSIYFFTFTDDFLGKHGSTLWQAKSQRPNTCYILEFLNP